MPDQMYPDMDAEGAPAEEAAETPKDEAAEGETALLPKTILGGKTFKPGDEVVLKIVREYENEVEVEYAPEKPEAGAEGEAAPEEAPTMEGAQNELSSMAY